MKLRRFFLVVLLVGGFWYLTTHLPTHLGDLSLANASGSSSPLELTEAYRSLAIELAAHPESKAASVVRAGLADSASFGMAGAASLGSAPVSGKTGTASAESGGPTHGWFVGLAPAKSPQVVVSVYLPVGRGSIAAQVAARLLAFSPLRTP